MCGHDNIHFENWPDGGVIEICNLCGMSRYHWEQGESDWIMIEDIPEVRKEVQKALDHMGISKGA